MSYEFINSEPSDFEKNISKLLYADKIDLNAKLTFQILYNEE